MNNLEKSYINIDKNDFIYDVYVCGSNNYQLDILPHFFIKYDNIELKIEIPNINEDLKLTNDNLLDDLNEWLNAPFHHFKKISNLEMIRTQWNTLNSDNPYVKKFDKCCGTK